MKFMVVTLTQVVVTIGPLTQEIQLLQRLLGPIIIPGLEIFRCMVKTLGIKDQNPNYLWQQLF